MSKGTDGDLYLDEDSTLDDSNDDHRRNTTAQSRSHKGSEARAVPNDAAKNAQAANRRDAISKEAHEQILRRELDGVRKVNEAMEVVLENLNRAKNNMKTVNQTVNAASTLLNIWTRILSQTEHNQRLILDPSWQGASQDIQDIEDEANARQQAVERREAEEQERKAAAVRKAEEDERKRIETTPKPRTGSTRARGGLGRSGSTRIAASANTSMSSISRGASSTRRVTSISRGTRGARSRGI